MTTLTNFTRGIVNIPKGDNNYNSALDRNHDNIACNQ